MAAIFVSSSIDGGDLPDVGISHADKVAHVSLYFILGSLLFRAIRKSSTKIGIVKITVLAIIIASCYGVSDEFHQYFVRDRTPDLADLLADIVGVNIGVFLIRSRKRG